MHWVLVIIIGFVIGYLIDFTIATAYRKLSKLKESSIHLNIRNLRVHHSCIGFFCFILSFFIYTFIFIGVGLGIIVGHTIREKSLLFIELKSKRFF